MNQGTVREYFQQKLNSLILQLKTHYIQFLKCLKFQNRKQRMIEEKLRRPKRNKYEQRQDYQQDNQNIIYSFNEQVSKQNRLEISYIKILQILNRLAQFNFELKQYVVINIEADFSTVKAIQVVESLINILSSK